MLVLLNGPKHYHLGHEDNRKSRRGCKNLLQENINVSNLHTLAGHKSLAIYPLYTAQLEFKSVLNQKLRVAVLLRNNVWDFEKEYRWQIINYFLSLCAN